MKGQIKCVKKKILTFLMAIIVTTIIYYAYQLNKIEDILTIRLDTRNELTETKILQGISNEMPYLPINDLISDANIKRNLNESCAWYPSFSDIQIRNNYWQELHYKNVSFSIFGAYLDKRPTVVKDKPMIRILTMINLLAINDEDYPKTFCQLWYEEQSQPIIMPAIELHRLWNYEWGYEMDKHYGHFISCALPKQHIDWIPQTVSLVAEPCEKATNNVKVIYQPLEKEKVKKEFVVCIKGLDNPYIDISLRLVEYIETLRSLGADKIVLYILEIHPNTTKVLEFYEQTGYIETRPFSSSLEVANLPKYRQMDLRKNYYPYILHEVIPLNDCLYRNMYHYDYMAVVDTNEILMPLGNLSNWHDVIEFSHSINDDNCKKFASLCFRCIYFPNYPQKPPYSKKFPNFFYMLQHVERVREHLEPELSMKCLHNTEHVIATHNNFPFQTTDDVCPSYSLKTSNAQLQHYREPDVKETFNDPVIDKSLWRLKDEIIERSLKILKELKFY